MDKKNKKRKEKRKEFNFFFASLLNTDCVVTSLIYDRLY